MMALTKTQRQAVEAQGARVLVSAGAGSGKTRVLVERFAHLVEQQGIGPEQILAFRSRRTSAAPWAPDRPDRRPRPPGPRG